MTHETRDRVREGKIGEKKKVDVGVNTGSSI